MHAGPLLPLAPENQVGEKKAPSTAVSQLRMLIEWVLPLRHFDVCMALDIIKWIQLRNYRSYLSHRAGGEASVLSGLVGLRLDKGQ
jgi:hypothetical protein